MINFTMCTTEKMKKELARLEDLKAYQILDTLAEEEYDDITQIVAQICDTPISLITLLDEHRQWFKSRFGLHITETVKEHSFCAHAIQETYEIFIVSDARKDPRFQNTPLVTGEPYIVFYAGVPLVSPQGYSLGTLCAIDHKPRTLDKKQISALQALAKQVVKLFELRKSNVKLHQSEERYRVLMENSIDMIFLLDEKGRIIEGNQAACNRLNYSPKEIAQLHIVDIDINETKDTLITHRRKKDKTLRFETVFKHKDGIQIPVEGNYIYFIQDSKKYIYCIARDITERKHAEKVIKESEERYKTFIDSVTEGVYRFDLKVPMDTTLPIEEQIQYLYANSFLAECNQEFLKMYGCSHESEILGKSLTEIHGGNNVAENVKAVRAFILSGCRIMQGETLEPDKQGKFHYYVNNTIGMLNEKGYLTHYWGTQADITKIKEYEKELILAKEKAEEKERLLKEKNEEIGRQNEIYQATNKELAESNRKIMNINKELQKANQELDNFVYRVSHDLRSPIASCLALVDLSAKEKNPRQLQEYLSMQEKSLRKQDKFIHDILNYSRNTRHEVESEVVDIKLMIEEIVNLSTHDHRDTNCSLEIMGNTKVVCDEMRLQMILNNLISNAFKYSAYAENPVVIINIKVMANELIMKIRDNGIGIPKESQSKIYEMFYRATSRSNGSGLGLYIVKEAVDKLKGSIQLVSEVGQGSTFMLKLPIRKAIDNRMECTTHTLDS